MTFLLHPQLAKDTIHAGDLPLSSVLLMNNRNFPWLILVPRRNNLSELFHLDADDYRILMDEIRVTTHHFSKLTKADKMNVAALGNMVPQLHIHIIARFKDDIAWPTPVWGSAIEPHEKQDLPDLIAGIRHSLNLV